jgi:hypothetical protein
VLPRERSLFNTVRGSLPFSIQVDKLAAVLIDIAENGAKKRTFENADLNKRANELAGK